MGTRGSWGFRLDGRDILAYNHFDSYPDGLGNDLLTCWLTFMQDVPPATLCSRVGVIDTAYTEEDPSPETVFELLRDGGEIGWRLNNTFVYDSLFCEWAYIFNLDDWTLEVYRGFNREPGGAGRYADTAPEGTRIDQSYMGVALVVAIPLADLSPLLKTTTTISGDLLLHPLVFQAR